MTYSVKEIYYTLQGEGAQSGRAAVFLRFGGCNLWSGLEKDRAQAVCRFCDTDFVGTDGPGGGKFAKAASLAHAVFAQWPQSAKGKPYVTLLPPAGIDWICVSPKADAEQKLKHGDELKLVYPQSGAEPERYAGQDFRNFFLQPMDGPDRSHNTDAATRYCLDHPQWRLSLQTHKLIGIR
jgi:7-carboxy-7-deazaguanine synthase